MMRAKGGHAIEAERRLVVAVPGDTVSTDADGTATCPNCPEGSTTHAAGSTSVSQCACQAGRFLSVDASGTASCPQPGPCW